MPHPDSEGHTAGLNTPIYRCTFADWVLLGLFGQQLLHVSTLSCHVVWAPCFITVLLLPQSLWCSLVECLEALVLSACWFSDNCLLTPCMSPQGKKCKINDWLIDQLLFVQRPPGNRYTEMLQLPMHHLSSHACLFRVTSTWWSGFEVYTHSV